MVPRAWPHLGRYRHVGWCPAIHFQVTHSSLNSLQNTLLKPEQAVSLHGLRHGIAQHSRLQPTCKLRRTERSHRTMLQLLCTGQRQCSMLHRSVLPAVEPRCTTAWTAHSVDGQHHGSVDSHVWRDSDSSHDTTRTGSCRSSVNPMRLEDMLPPALNRRQERVELQSVFCVFLASHEGSEEANQIGARSMPGSVHQSGRNPRRKRHVRAERKKHSEASEAKRRISHPE